MAKKKRYKQAVEKQPVPQKRKRQSQRQEQVSKPKKKKVEKEIKDYTQDFINIKDIKNGIIETHDNRYLKILEIEPINFMLRTPEEQNIIISNYAGWFKIANIKLQFKSITKKADTERHIELLKRDIENEENEETKELSKAYIKLIRDVGNQEALTRRFFVIMEYEPMDGNGRAAEYTEIYQTIMTAAQTLKQTLSGCGNNVIVHDNEDMFLAETLYMFFNRRSSIDEPLSSRISRIVEDTMESKGRVYGRDEIPAIPIVNYIAPRGLDLSHVGYIIMDGLYYSFLYIKDNGYPNKVRGGWMSLLVNAGEGIDVDIHFKKEPKNKAIDSVARKVRLNNVKLKSTYDTQSDYETLRNSISSGYFLKESLSRGEDLWWMSTLITVSSKTLDGLKWKKKRLQDTLRSKDMEASELKFRQEAALQSVLPLLDLDKSIFEKSKRNVTTFTAASTYMFTSFEMSDDNGILLGINQHNSSLCIVDIFNSKMYKNANMCIIGTSGAGKTFTEQLMALRMRMRGIQCFILAPLKGHEFRRACVNIGGQYIKISASSPHCINVMEIRIPDASSDELIEGEGAIEEDSWLSRKIQQLNVFFSLLIPEMSNEEEQLLDEAIIDTYAMKGITHDNESLYQDEEMTQLKQMPVIGDLHNQLSTNDATRSIANIINRFVHGSAQSFNRQTNVDLDNKYIVMDISELKGKLLPVGMFIALDYVWDKTKEDRTKKKAIFIDETWMLIGASSNKFAAEFVLEVFKIIRGYGGAAIAATQDLGDFFALEGGKYGRGIVNNSKTKIILNLEPDEAEFVRDSMKLSKTEYRKILSFNRGEGLIASNNNKVPVLIKPSETEKALITTDREELAIQAQKKQEDALKKEKAARDQEMAAKRKLT